ncbi:MAG: hypothetical protein E2P00_01550 [Acidobacteria bacterium]|nr:MAG: hypothetical protein E2P00_01550 [Acidobacteriota bacterium]
MVPDRHGAGPGRAVRPRWRPGWPGCADSRLEGPRRWLTAFAGRLRDPGGRGSADGRTLPPGPSLPGATPGAPGPPPAPGWASAAPPVPCPWASPPALPVAP